MASCSGVTEDWKRCNSLRAKHTSKHTRNGYFCDDHRGQTGWCADVAIEERIGRAINKECCGVTTTRELGPCKLNSRSRETFSFCRHHLDQRPPTWTLPKQPKVEECDDKVHLRLRKRLLDFVGAYNEWKDLKPDYQSQSSGPSGAQPPPQESTEESDDVPSPEAEAKPTASDAQPFFVVFFIPLYYTFSHPILSPFIFCSLLTIAGLCWKKAGGWAGIWKKNGGARKSPSSRSKRAKEEADVEDEGRRQEPEEETHHEAEEEKRAHDPEQDCKEEEAKHNADADADADNEGEDHEQEFTGEGEQEQEHEEPDPEERPIEEDKPDSEPISDYRDSLARFLARDWSIDNPASFDKIPWPVFVRPGHIPQPGDVTEQAVKTFLEVGTVNNAALLKELRRSLHPDNFRRRGAVTSINDKAEKMMVQAKVTMISQCINSIWESQQEE
ncbi:hypothetical protein V5O48_008485 [Marasmius crinis-equi]|uniref:Uncharacterized protein n=1 Tax=Marasmius crinis-equi TaxID=585013 RepID=A0ABR3FDS2_9AGAR